MNDIKLKLNMDGSKKFTERTKMSQNRLVTKNSFCKVT